MNKMATPVTPAPLDAEAVRADFPVFKTRIYGKPLTFLDTAASAQKPQAVIDRVNHFYAHEYANIHRGMYKLSLEATEAYEAARARVARLINAPKAETCLFVRGATEGFNLVAQAWGRERLTAGDEIVLTEMEHHSNIVPWQILREQIGVKLRIVPVTDEGEVRLEDVKAALSDRTKLVSILHISNALGSVLPVREITDMAHAAGAKVLIDACQAVPHMPVDVQAIGADMYVFSGHKLYGPTGIGVLWAREEILEDMPPWQGGGDMIETVTFEKTTFNVPPQKFEAGTPNIAGAIGLAAAIDYADNLGLAAIDAHERRLRELAESRLRRINQVRIIGEARDKAGILSFVLKDIHPHDAGTILDREGVAVRTGHHCCQPLMDRYNVPATVRASFGPYNTEADVDRLIHGTKKVLEIFA